jgi:hypothetical protein
MTTDTSIRSALEAAVAEARQAPSVHNTQPWNFRIGDDSVELLADFSRQLPVLDPTGRQLHVSCGATLQHLVVALRAAGFDSVVKLLPSDDPQLLASVQVTEGAPADGEELALAAAIPVRHSQRDPFAGQAVEHEALAQLRKAAEAEGAWLALLESRDDQIMLAVLLSHADAAEASSPEYKDELQHWLRTDPSFDGIPVSALPTVADRHSEVIVRDFTAGDAAPASGDSPAPDERPALVILGTDGDTPREWLTAGRALSRLLLTATTLDLRASMLGQVIDLPGIRQQLRTELRLVGEPQMVVRIGYGPLAPASPRRPVSEIVVD